MIVMIPQTFKQHTRSFLKKSNILYQTGRVNPVVCSIIIIETYFRPWSLRLLEIIVWIITKNQNLTIGLAQAKAFTWNRMGEFQKKNLFSRMSFLNCYKANYDIVFNSLLLNNINMCNLEEVVRFYNGDCYRKSYLNFLKYAVMVLSQDARK